MNDDDRSLKLSTSSEELVVLVIRIVCLGLLGYWSFILIRPFLTIIVWSIIITVALYPIFDWRGGPALRDSSAAWLRWILGSITPPISPRLPA